jgi:hypothetical protein
MGDPVRNPTMIAKCGCPYDPEYDEGHLGWHLTKNHIPETLQSALLDLRMMEQQIENVLAELGPDSP